MERGVENPLNLIQMVPTRFNSEYFMLNRMVQLKKSLTEAISNTTLKDTLSGPEWDELERLVAVFGPLHVVTQMASAKDSPTFSMVIPLIRGVIFKLKNLAKNWDPKSWSSSFVKELTSAISSRFPEFDDQKKAVFLDPRFKGALFTKEVLQEIENTLLEEIEEEACQSGSSQTSPNCSQQCRFPFTGSYTQIKNTL